MELELTAIRTDAAQAARTLGELLRQTPEYEAFLTAFHAVYEDSSIQTLSAQVRAHRTAIQRGQDADGSHTTELVRLELELEDLPEVREYRRAEREVAALFRAVDEIVSKEAGVALAVNAEQCACACRA